MTAIDEINLEKQPDPDRTRFDYRGHHRYLVTLPVYGERAAFANREVVFTLLGALRDAAQQHLFEVYAYCFLPDRLAMIVRGREEESDFRVFIHAFRTTTGEPYEAAQGHTLWSRKFQERVLRKEEGTKEAAQELFMLPVKAGFVRRPQDYALLGSFIQSVTDILPPPEPRPERHGAHPSGGHSERPRFTRGDQPWRPKTAGERHERPERERTRPEGFKPTGFKPRGFKPGGFKPGGSRPGGFKPGGSRPGGFKPGGSRPGGFKPGGSRPGGFKPGGFKPEGSKPGGFKPGGFKPRGYKPGGFKPGGFKPGGFKPRGFKRGGPGGQRPGGPHRGTPRNNRPAGPTEPKE